jgi:hypothetical protein
LEWARSLEFARRFRRPAAVGRLLGQTAAAPATTTAAPSLSSRFNLIGVVAGRSQQGAALIAVDGRPAKPYRVGSAVDEGLVLQSVAPRRAVLAASAAGPAVVTLEMPVQATTPLSAAAQASSIVSQPPNGTSPLGQSEAEPTDARRGPADGPRAPRPHA